MNQEADAILQEYQEQASDGQLKFRRWPLRSVCYHLTRSGAID